MGTFAVDAAEQQQVPSGDAIHYLVLRKLASPPAGPGTPPISEALRPLHAPTAAG